MEQPRMGDRVSYLIRQARAVPAIVVSTHADNTVDLTVFAGPEFGDEFKSGSAYKANVGVKEPSGDLPAGVCFYAPDQWAPRRQAGGHTDSATPVKDIPLQGLKHALEVAYQDLAFTMARVIAITWRLDPGESLMSAFGGALACLVSGLAEMVLDQSETA